VSGLHGKHDKLLQAMLQHTALLVTLCHFIVTYRLQDAVESFDMISLV
jgi:hypothetical protein